MKQDFLNFLEALMEHDADFTSFLMTDDIQMFIESLRDAEIAKPELTENGKSILKHLRTMPNKTFKARDIAEDLFKSSRSVSGAMRKLVTDGFCERIAKDPAIYALTEKGKNYVID